MAMDSILPEGHLSPSDHQNHIQHWQKSTATEPEKQAQGIIARIFENCHESLRYLVIHLAQTSSSRCDRVILKRCHSLLRLWAEDHGVLSGRLDETLDRSRNLRQTTLTILNPLCKTLLQGLKEHVLLRNNDETIQHLCKAAAELYSQTRWLLTDADNDASDSESESDSENDSSNSGDDAPTGNLKDLIQKVKVYTDYLLDLGVALDCPALEPEHKDEPSFVRLEQRSAHDYHTDLIMAKFPQANIGLLHNLGKTSWERYQRMQQERESNAYKQHVSFPGDKSHAPNSEFQDSGIGLSLPPPPSSYAETIVSFMTSVTGGKRVNIPPLPADAKRGSPFECNACGKYIRATNNRDWRKHLYTDLRPYTCVFVECTFSTEPFVNRQLWSDHLELDHSFAPVWASVQCPLCLETTGSGKSAVLVHFARHMEDIALASLPRDVESDTESETGTLSECTSEPNSQLLHENSLEGAATGSYQLHDRKGLSVSEEDISSAKVPDATINQEQRIELQNTHVNEEERNNPVTNDTLNETKPDIWDLDSEVDGDIECICGFTHDDGNTVMCKICNSPQHIICYYESAGHVPDVHKCLDCFPRPMNTRIAMQKQLRRREDGRGKRYTFSDMLQTAEEISILLESTSAPLDVAHPRQRSKLLTATDFCQDETVVPLATDDAQQFDTSKLPTALLASEAEPTVKLGAEPKYVETDEPSDVAADERLTFVVESSPNDFKFKEHVSAVRRQAMRSYSRQGEDGGQPLESRAFADAPQERHIELKTIATGPTANANPHNEGLRLTVPNPSHEPDLDDNDEAELWEEGPWEEVSWIKGAPESVLSLDPMTTVPTSYGSFAHSGPSGYTSHIPVPPHVHTYATPPTLSDATSTKPSGNVPHAPTSDVPDFGIRLPSIGNLPPSPTSDVPGFKNCLPPIGNLPREPMYEAPDSKVRLPPIRNVPHASTYVVPDFRIRLPPIKPLGHISHAPTSVPDSELRLPPMGFLSTTRSTKKRT